MSNTAVLNYDGNMIPKFPQGPWKGLSVSQLIMKSGEKISGYLSPGLIPQPYDHLQFD